MLPVEVTKNLPSAEELLRSLGLQRARSNGDMLSGIAVFGAGMLVGAGLALLFAPSSGSEIREQIGSRLEEVRERVAKASSEGGRQSSQAATAG